MLLGLLLIAACRPDAPATAAPPTEPGTALPAGSRLPRFGYDADRLLLSYVLSDSAAGDRLYARAYGPGGWGADTLVAEGRNWFINWADFPSVQPLGAGLFHHYLAYTGSGTYDYAIQYGTGALSDTVLHNDGVPGEHGFVSSAPLPGGARQVTWLDGRKSGAASAGHDHHGGGGAMTLRTARVAPDGTVTGRTELDARTCDCCNTATVTAGTTTLVAYRDRSEKEVRDISFRVREGEGDWSEIRPVHEDNWEVTGCPVNGPALAAADDGTIAVAWYTAAEGRPRVQVARYDAAGRAFGPPVTVDADEPLGRVDLQLGDDGTAYVLAMATTGNMDSTAVTLYTVSPEEAVTRREIARVASARRSGFPKLARTGNELWCAYTEVDGLATRVRLRQVLP